MTRIETNRTFIEKRRKLYNELDKQCHKKRTTHTHTLGAEQRSLTNQAAEWSLKRKESQQTYSVSACCSLSLHSVVAQSMGFFTYELL